MKGFVLGLAGSPREGGNSRLLLEAFLEGVRKEKLAAEEIVLAELDIEPCLECGGCDDTGICIVSDDMDYVYQNVKSAAGLVVATPIFFGHLPAQAKAAIDRFQSWWVARYLLGKPVFQKKRPGSLIVVGGMDRVDYFECIKKTIKAFFATTGFSYFSELYLSRVDEKGAVLKRKEDLEKSFELGRQLAMEIKSKTSKS